MKKLQIPNTIWVAWCRSCGVWLDETESAKGSTALALDEHPEHFNDPDHKHRVEVIPFRRDLDCARPVAAQKGSEAAK